MFVLFYDDKREVYWKEPEGIVPSDIEDALSDGTLAYEVIRPMDLWRIVYQGKEISAEISWNGRFPYYDFGGGSGTSWTGHFEQSGAVKGTVTFQDGREFNIKGFGERDKSWGSRDWHIEAWYALHAQFDDLSIGLRRDYVDGAYFPSGGISTKDGHIPITRVDLDTEFLQDRMPYAAKTTVFGEDGSCYTLRSKIISDTAYVRFTRDFPGGSTELWEEMAVHENEDTGEEGTGLLEWLFTF
ncbi:MAG: hypothetical protein EAX95_10145 [Candidatus Thorarchaeota archaeon]|nr:hypothetical protein [Candidatus Thorarchaeota archaeon]